MSGLNKTFFSVSVSETDLNREKLRAFDWVTDKAAVGNADVLVLPWHKIDEGEAAIYPQGTADIFKFLQAVGFESISLIVPRDEYREIAMHGKAWRLPALFLSAMAVPVFVNVLSDKISDMMPGAEPDDTVHFEMTVERPHSPCVTIKYEGPASRFSETMITESAKCFEEEAPSHQTPAHRGKR